jgi:CRISPR/Cas system-associated exonuclease Cas4 (RecB family)
LRHGVKQVPGFPFNLNSAVDALLKKEFDYYRSKQKPHPLMAKNKIKAVPFKHPRIEEWRESLTKGITFLHEKTNLFITGGVDDIWIKPNKELIIVDYKATSKKGEVSLDADWQIGYKRQMEIYQWLFRKNGFEVSDTGFFVYCNGDTSKKKLGGILEFKIKVIPYKGNDNWVDKTIMDIYECIQKPDMPESGSDCDFCKYREAVDQIK